jgi:N-acetylglucosaminyl-diphospho-decaprenol L-rhamnosyltransferase
MDELALVIVTWNVSDRLRACLTSALAELNRSDTAASIWVVDNASRDGSAEMVRRDFPQVHLQVNDDNVGFAAGNNLALRALGFERAGEVGLPSGVLFLNPDTELLPGALNALHSCLKRYPRAGVVGAQLQYGDGRFQHSAFDFPGFWQAALDLFPCPRRVYESRLNGRYARRKYLAGEPFPIGHPLGAVMLVRREAILQTGLLDEGYFMYAEEVDWCLRMRAAGWKAYCAPGARVVHHSGQSTAQIHLESLVNLWRSRYRLYSQNYGQRKVWLTRWLVVAGMRRWARQVKERARRGELTSETLAQQLKAYLHVEQFWLGTIR